MKLADLDLLAIGNEIGLSGAVFSGQGKLILCMFPEERGSVMAPDGTDRMVYFLPRASGEDGDLLDVHVLDMDDEDWKKFLRQTDVLEAEVLRMASDGTLAKVVLRKSARMIEARVSWHVFKRDGYRCRYCGRDDVPLTVDHLVLWEEGGPSVPENLVSACRKCNKTRGRTPYAEWLESRSYRTVSKGLTAEVREANAALSGTLDAIPRMVHTKSR